MSFRVWMECPVLESEALRLAEHAELERNREPEGVKGCHAAIITARPTVNGAFLDAAPDLCLVVRHGIGYDNVDVKAATERGVLVANTPDGPTESTAEHTVSTMGRAVMIAVWVQPPGVCHAARGPSTASRRSNR